MKDCGYYTRKVVNALCKSRCILSDNLFSDGLEINVIATVLYCMDVGYICRRRFNG